MAADAPGPRIQGVGARGARDRQSRRDADAGELAELVVAAHARAELERAIDALPDHEIVAATEAATIELVA